MEVIYRCYHDTWGWGNVLLETKHFVIVLFDADSHTFHQLPKEVIK